MISIRWATSCCPHPLKSRRQLVMRVGQSMFHLSQREALGVMLAIHRRLYPKLPSMLPPVRTWQAALLHRFAGERSAPLASRARVR